MDAKDLDRLLGQVGHAGKLVPVAFEVLTGEKLDLDSTVRHRPVAALVLVAGLAGVGGWWLGHRSQPPQPEPQTGKEIEALRAQLRELRARLDESRKNVRPAETFERLREVIPELQSEQTAQRVRGWMDTVLEPRLRQGVEEANGSAERLSKNLRQRLRQAGRPHDTELDEPPGPQDGEIDRRKLP